MRLRPPADVRARAGAARVLAWVPSGTSSVIATDEALLLPPGEGDERVPWDLVVRVTWPDGGLEVAAAPRRGARPEVRSVPVDGPLGALPQVVRERVDASILVQEHVALVGESGARMVARRAAGSDEVRWSVVFDPGLDPSDPVLREQADAALADLRASLGI